MSSEIVREDAKNTKILSSCLHERNQYVEAHHVDPHLISYHCIRGLQTAWLAKIEAHAHSAFYAHACAWSTRAANQACS